MTDIDKIIAEIVPKYRNMEGKPRIPQDFKLVYDSSSETLEPIYFWVLDWLDRNYGGKVEKLIDNFASSPGSGHFGEMQGRASQMQQEASRVLGTINNILKGIINLIYDLREFKIRLSHYETAGSKDRFKAEAGILALKQIWMDRVDILRGQGSLNAMSSGNLQFVTLRDAFMVVNSPEEVDKLDLNERVKRVLKPRVQEFFEWKKRSYEELKKRFEIERIYLKSQVDALKLNARWARPYLRAAEQLRSNEGLMSNPGMVTAFNTIILELAIMARKSMDIADATAANPRGRDLPEEFRKIKKLRNYNAVVFVDFNFRGIPGKTGQHYTFGGKAEVLFRAYALTDNEIDILKYRLEKSDIHSALNLVEGMTTESLQQITADIEEFLPENKEKKEEPEGENPFEALFSIFKSKKKKSKTETSEEKEARLKKLDKEIEKKGHFKPDNYPEKYIRNYQEAYAMNLCFHVYDKYKKAHGMNTFPYGGDDAEPSPPQTSADQLFGFK